jgi:hypothetical protein
MVIIRVFIIGPSEVHALPLGIAPEMARNLSQNLQKLLHFCVWQS